MPISKKQKLLSFLPTHINCFQLILVAIFFFGMISHHSIEIIRYVFLALLILNLEFLKKAITSKGALLLVCFIFVVIISNFINSISLSYLDRPLNWLIAYLIGYIALIKNKEKKIIDICINILALILVTQFLYHRHGNIFDGRYANHMNSPNQFAIIVLIPLYFYIFKFLTCLKNFKNIKNSIFSLLFNLLCFAFFYFLLLTTKARTIVILNSLLLITMPLFLLTKKQALTIIVLVGTFLLSSLLFLSPQYKQRFVDSVVHFQSDSSFQERFPIWFAAEKCFWEKPILGNGLGSFRACYEKHLPEYKNLHPKMPYLNTTNHAHNFFLHFLAETGIVGTLFILIFFSVSVFYAVSSNRYVYLAYIIVGSIGGFMMNMNFYIREISTFLMIITGWIFALKELEKQGSL
ncbi:MAG: O-antigen ligase family protein [Desulfonauticus sp.]|nr:O-antigen ligase family protein [Desulfonauticus sp.]